MKINLEGYDLIGTPAEMLELLNLLSEEAAVVEEPAPETPEAPKPAPKKTAKPAGKQVDWSKAAALRNAGWSFEKIGEELGVSGVTVSAHLNKKTHLM